MNNLRGFFIYWSTFRGTAVVFQKKISYFTIGKPTLIDPVSPRQSSPLRPFQKNPQSPRQNDPLKMEKIFLSPEAPVPAKASWLPHWANRPV